MFKNEIRRSPTHLRTKDELFDDDRRNLDPKLVVGRWLMEHGK
ncbi:MAG TPA: hypothetical protein V6D10_09535 [Trichocoleus sp.]|jgi:hypothetical protein